MCQVSFQRGIITQPGVTSSYFTFSCLSLAGLELWVQTLLCPPSAPAQLLFRGRWWGPCLPGDAAEDLGLLATTTEEQRGRGLAAPLPARGSLAGLDFLAAVPNSPGLTPISPLLAAGGPSCPGLCWGRRLWLFPV